MDKKISQLTAVASLAGTETLPVVQSGSTMKATINNVKAYVLNSASLTSGYLPYYNGTSLVNSYLSQTGNTIVVDSGKSLKSGTSLIQFNAYAQNDVTITSDNGAYAKGALYAGDDNVEMYGGTGVTAKIYANNAIKFQASAVETNIHGYDPNDQIIMANGSIRFILDKATGTSSSIELKNNEGGNAISENEDTIAVFINSKGSTINAGVVNSVVIGGSAITATDNDTVYVPTLNAVTKVVSPLVYGSTSASGTLTIGSTSHATKGKIYLGSSSGFTFNETDGGVSIGNDSQSITIAGVTYKISHSTHNNLTTYINNEIHSASNTATLGAVQIGTRSRGTYGTPLTVADDDNLFDVYAIGYDGTDYAISSAIEMEVDNTVAANQVPGRIKFSTANASGTLTEAFRIDSTQYGIFATGIQGTYLTAYELLGTDASKNIVSLPVATYPSLAELAYVKGVTSAIQTQLNAKLAIASNLSDLNNAATARTNLGAPFLIKFVSATFNPADSTTYYITTAGNAPSTTATNAAYNLGYAFTIIGAVIIVSSTGAGSSENCTLQMRNITQATSSNIGTFQSDVATTAQETFSFTGLNISVAATDNIAPKVDTPAWVTNPSVRYYIHLICIRN